MKKINVILKMLVAVFFTSILFSCSNDNDEQLEIQEFKNWSLISPNGKKLAESEEDLINLFSEKVGISQSVSEFKIIDIRYTEKIDYSFGVVDIKLNEELKSMLIILDVDKSTKILSDRDGIKFVQTNNINIDNVDKSSILSVNDNKSRASLSPDTTFVCNGGCCTFSQTGPDSYNCGCPVPPTPSTSLTLTTSDGCAVLTP
jgi:hypothetical protein